MTGAAHWDVLIRARAIETQCYVLAAAQGGTHPGPRETWGHAAIVDPWGRVLAQQDQGEAVLLAERDSSEQASITGADAGVQSPALFLAGRPATCLRTMNLRRKAYERVVVLSQ